MAVSLVPHQSTTPSPATGEFRHSFRQATACGVSRGASWGVGPAKSRGNPRRCWPYEFRQTLLGTPTESPQTPVSAARDIIIQRCY
jgi:hypothetical protein